MTVDKMTEDSPLKLDGLFHIESLLITTHVVINANLLVVITRKNSRGHVLGLCANSRHLEFLDDMIIRAMGVPSDGCWKILSKINQDTW